MIYPALQKTRITEEFIFLPEKIIINGYESEFAKSILKEKSGRECKGKLLYIDIVKENSRRTEYVEETCRLTDEKFIIRAEKDTDSVHMILTVSGKKSLYRAMNRISMMLESENFFCGDAEDYPLFAERGYIEGFYGKPWCFENRKMMLEFLSFYGMNTHYYAPKDDPYHRDKWDDLYPEKELSQLSELVKKAEQNFVDFYFCLAPGLSMKYSSDEDFLKLVRKVKQLYSIGIRNFGLLVDDIPENLYFDDDKEAFDGEAVNAHIYICNKLYDFLKSEDYACRLTVCPLQYHGNGDEYYITKLGKGLSGGIKIFWTGGNICSQKLTVREAVIFENSTNRKPLYWDNFPVNDAEMQNEMHIGYISGRDAELYRYSEGIISNVMEYCLSSRIPLLTVCDYLWNPTKYNGYESWLKACSIVLGNDAEKVAPFLDNLLTSCLKVENSPMLNVCLNDAQQMYFAGDTEAAIETASVYLTGLKECCQHIETVENPMYKELEPWFEKQKIALDLFEKSAGILFNNTDDAKNEVRAVLRKYLDHPKTLCDFSLQAFAERMLTL